jgi:hypothetical protein
VADGKRFCGSCGQAMPVVATPAQPTVLPDQTAISCVMCGTALTPGKRFCRQCGHAIDAPALAAPVEAASAGKGEALLQESKALDLPPAMPVDAPVGMPAPTRNEPSLILASPEIASEPDVAVQTLNGSATPWTSSWETVKQKPPDSPLTALVSGSSALSPVPRGGSAQKMGIAISITAVVLVVAGVWAFYAHGHRSVSSETKTDSESQRNIAPLPEKSAKPSASIPAPPAPSMIESQPKSETSIASATLPSKLPQDSRQHPTKITQQPEPESPPLQPPQPSVPASLHSGILHYQGPPVPFNGVVIFDHLPQARLKFNFDRQAWTLTIKPNPDGTKRVTMISQKQGYQTNCDLNWEIVE